MNPQTFSAEDVSLLAGYLTEHSAKAVRRPAGEDRNKLAEVAALVTIFESRADECEKSAKRMTATQLEASLRGEASGWRNAAYILRHLLESK
jgi:hypothetical protein